MTVVKSISDLTGIEYMAVPLARYAQIVNYNECAFWGVNNPDDDTRACRQLWSKAQRDDAAHYLAEAQSELEAVLGYPLSPRWFADEPHPYSHPVMTIWGKVIEIGVKATSEIEDGSAVDHTNDPAVVGPIATTVTDEDEVHVYHPGTDVEISPSDISISGGNVTITIPRCRMVLAALADEDSIDYTVIANFEQTVDVTRVYNDPSEAAEVVWPHACSSTCSSTSCSEYTKTACLYIDSAEVGILTFRFATYSGGTWTPTTACCNGTPGIIRLNYRAGVTPLPLQMEDAIVRLAHAKMADEPCGCKTVQRLWMRDREVPQVLTRERINCPFGLNNGAWIAWRFAQAARLVRGSTL